MLTSMDCRLPCSLSSFWFLLWQVIFYWNLSVFVYVMRLRILFKPPVLVGFFWHCFGRVSGRDVTWSLDTQGGWVPITPGWGGSSSPYGLRWHWGSGGPIPTGQQWYSWAFIRLPLVLLQCRAERCSMLLPTGGGSLGRGSGLVCADERPGLDISDAIPVECWGTSLHSMKVQS